MPPDAIAALVGVLAECALLRDNEAKKNWKSIVERLVKNEACRNKCWAYDMRSGNSVGVLGERRWEARRARPAEGAVSGE